MSTSERAILNHVYGLLTNKPAELQQANRMQRRLNILSTVILTGAVLLAELTDTPDFICVILGAAGGVLLTIPAYLRILLANWPHLAPYIDEQRVKSRLDLLQHL